MLLVVILLVLGLPATAGAVQIECSRHPHRIESRPAQAPAINGDIVTYTLSLVLGGSGLLA
jgi:hypothetical protein